MPDLRVDLHPCPGCGFLSVCGARGTYAVCEVCQWKDDRVQLANPTSADLMYGRAPVFGFETVHTMTDFYDGPRSGLVDYHGAPHHYESNWDDYSDGGTSLLLRPIEPEVLALALEDWWFWLRWETAYHSNQTSGATHPALPAEHERHLELTRALDSALPPAGKGVPAIGTFSWPERSPGSALGWRGLAVRWTTLL